MRKQLLMIPALALVLALAACSGMTPKRKTYNSIYLTELSTGTAVEAYFAAVAQGTAPTNGVPTVAKAFNLFQGVAQVAVQFMNGNSNAPAPPNLLIESQKVLSAVDAAKKGKS